MSAPEREWVRGVPMPLPPGEHIRWQGAPDERALARHVFHVRKIALYFGLLFLWRAALAAGEAAPAAYFLAGAMPLAAFATLAIACSLFLARLTARRTVYALTDRRIVLRTGIVLTATINIPFRRIAAVSLRGYPGGSGDLALELSGEDRLGFLVLWPHARAWRLSRPQPTLRCVPDAAAVGAMLRDGLSEAPAESAPAPAPLAALAEASA